MQEVSNDTTTEESGEANEYASVIRTLREELGRIRGGTALTQQQFARAIGVSASSVSRWEKGAAKPGKTARYAIAGLAGEDGLKLDPDSLRGVAINAPLPAPQPQQSSERPEAAKVVVLDACDGAATEAAFAPDFEQAEDSEYDYSPDFVALTTAASLMLAAWWLLG